MVKLVLRWHAAHSLTTFLCIELSVRSFRQPPPTHSSADPCACAQRQFQSGMTLCSGRWLGERSDTTTWHFNTFTNLVVLLVHWIARASAPGYLDSERGPHSHWLICHNGLMIDGNWSVLARHPTDANTRCRLSTCNMSQDITFFTPTFSVIMTCSHTSRLLGRTNKPVYKVIITT